MSIPKWQFRHDERDKFYFNEKLYRCLCKIKSLLIIIESCRLSCYGNLKLFKKKSTWNEKITWSFGRERKNEKKCNQGWKEEVLILETSRRCHNVSVSLCHIQWERLDGKMNFLDKVPYGLIKMLVVLWCGVCVMRKNVLSLLYQGTNKRHDNAI